MGNPQLDQDLIDRAILKGLELLGKTDRVRAVLRGSDVMRLPRLIGRAMGHGAVIEFEIDGNACMMVSARKTRSTSIPLLAINGQMVLVGGLLADALQGCWGRELSYGNDYRDLRVWLGGWCNPRRYRNVNARGGRQSR